MRIQPIFALTLLAPLSLTACSDDPPTPAATRSRITTDLGNVLREANAALAGGDALPGSATLALLDRVVGSTAAAQLPGAMADLSIDADASVRFLDDQLFTDANHVGDGVYQVPAALVCKRTTVDTAGVPTTAVDAECAAKLAQLDLRIRTATDGDSLTFALQLDADHDEPLRLSLDHTSIALTLDFDELQRAEAAVAAVLATDPPSARLAGQLTGKLAVLGTAKIEASLAIDRALAIQVAAAGTALDGPDATLLTSGQADGFSITLDGNTRAGSVAAALARTVLRLPKIGDQQLELDLAGLSAAATFAAGQPLQLTHLGLGDGSTTLAINGQRAETIDLNPNDGRALDARITRDDASGTTTVALSPRLDLHVAVDHAVLGDDLPLFDITRVQLDGSLIGHDASDQVQVASGTLAITTNPASYGITATAGQCVTSQAASDPTTGAPYTRWTVGACL